MWVGIVLSSSGGRIILRALAAELFSTAQRAPASGFLAILETLGAPTALFVLYYLERRAGRLRPTTKELLDPRGNWADRVDSPTS